MNIFGNKSNSDGTNNSQKDRSDSQNNKGSRFSSTVTDGAPGGMVVSNKQNFASAITFGN